MKSLFHVSERQHSGLILMTELATVYTDGECSSLKDIATRMRISEGYLEEIAHRLKTAGLIAGQRGPGGGYALTRSPEQITAAEIVEAIEGPIAFVECQSGKQCPVEAGCKSKGLWDQLQSTVAERLRTTTLSSIAN